MEDNDIFWKRKSGGGFEKFLANCERGREGERSEIRLIRSKKQRTTTLLISLDKFWSCFLYKATLYTLLFDYTHVFGLELLVVSSNNEFLQFLEMAVQEFDVLQPQLLADDLEIPDGVHVSLHVGNVVVIERSCVKNRDMRRKKIPQNLRSLCVLLSRDKVRDSLDDTRQERRKKKNERLIIKIAFNLRQRWKIPSQALMCERKLFPSPCPSAAPLTNPAMSTTFKKAGTLL